MLVFMVSIALLNASVATPRFGVRLTKSSTRAKSISLLRRLVQLLTRFGNVNDAEPYLL
jgi:hypothetical protein